MYFANGWPCILSLPLIDNEHIIEVEKNPYNKLLLVVSNLRIFLWWQDQSTILLGKTVTIPSIPYKQAIWVPSKTTNNQICILDEEGKIHLYEVQQQQQNRHLFEYKFSQKIDSTSYRPLQQIPSMEIIYKKTILNRQKNSGQATCLCYCNPYIILGTTNGNLLLFHSIQASNIQRIFSVVEDLLEPEPTYLPTTTFSSSFGNSITQIIFSGGLLGFVFKDGRAGVLPLYVDEKNKDQSSLNSRFSFILDHNHHDIEISLKIFLKIKELPANHKQKGKWLVQAGATCMAFSSRHQLLAVGHQSGEISLFQSVHVELDQMNVTKPSDVDQDDKQEEEDDDEYQESFDILRILSLIHWEISLSITGKVNHLQWSPDENVLAVGWADRGLAVWSIYGCRLMCTISSTTESALHEDHLQEEKLKSNSMILHQEPFRNGVLAMTWGKDGYSIFAIQKQCKNDPLTNSLLQIQFIKSSLVNNPSLHYSNDIIMQGSDSIYLIHKSNVIESSFSHLQIPQTYLTDNWPIQMISMDRLGKYIAVAGNRGFIVFNMIKNKWRLFGNQKEEQKIQCISISWYKSIILVLNKIEDKNQYEILCFPHNHLAFSSLLYKFDIPCKNSNISPISMDCNDNLLIIFMDDSFVFQLKIDHKMNSETGEISSLQMKIIHQTTSTAVHSLLSFLALPSFHVVQPQDHQNSSLLHSSLSNSHQINWSKEFLILDGSGRFSIANPDYGQDIELASCIEQFWYCGLSQNQSKTDNLQDYQFQYCLFGYGESGIRIWFPFKGSDFIKQSKSNSRLNSPARKPFNLSSSSSFISIEPENTLEFDVEVYPLSFSKENAIIIGVSQVTSYSEASVYPRYDIMIRSQPFLHILLSHLIQTNEDLSIPKFVAHTYSSIPHFTFSLELLLHEALESKNSKRSLPKVIRFLQEFSIFPEIIVRCARKTDVSYWDLLFQHAGKPIDLFNLCVSRHYYVSAASFLRVIQIIHSIDLANDAGNRLLNELGENNKLTPDLKRFLESQN